MYVYTTYINEQVVDYQQLNMHVNKFSFSLVTYSHRNSNSNCELVSIISLYHLLFSTISKSHLKEKTNGGEKSLKNLKLERILCLKWEIKMLFVITFFCIIFYYLCLTTLYNFIKDFSIFCLYINNILCCCWFIFFNGKFKNFGVQSTYLPTKIINLKSLTCSLHLARHKLHDLLTSMNNFINSTFSQNLMCGVWIDLIFFKSFFNCHIIP